VIELTDEMRDALAVALAQGVPMTVATASKAGVPDIAYKGSALVWDTEHLAFWERSHGQTLRNLQENPNVCLLYANFQARASWKFFGVVQLLADGPVREGIMARTPELELQRDPERTGVAVLVRVDRVLQRGQVVMERD